MHSSFMGDAGQVAFTDDSATVSHGVLYGKNLLLIILVPYDILVFPHNCNHWTALTHIQNSVDVDSEVHRISRYFSRPCLMWGWLMG